MISVTAAPTRALLRLFFHLRSKAAPAVAPPGIVRRGRRASGPCCSLLGQPAPTSKLNHTSHDFWHSRSPTLDHYCPRRRKRRYCRHLMPTAPASQRTGVVVVYRTTPYSPLGQNSANYLVCRAVPHDPVAAVPKEYTVHEQNNFVFPEYGKHCLTL